MELFLLSCICGCLALFSVLHRPYSLFKQAVVQDTYAELLTDMIAAESRWDVADIITVSFFFMVSTVAYTYMTIWSIVTYPVISVVMLAATVYRWYLVIIMSFIWRWFLRKSDELINTRIAWWDNITGRYAHQLVLFRYMAIYIVPILYFIIVATIEFLSFFPQE